MALAASSGFKVMVADAANAFDPYVVAKFSRREGIPEEELLKKIAVARGFTCHQISTLVRERLEPMIPSGVAPLIVLLGPGNTFFDEDVPIEEAALLFRRMMASVAEMSRKGFFFLMSQSFSKGNGQRSFLLRELAGSADAVLKLKPEADTLRVIMDKPRMAFRKPWGAFEEFKKLTNQSCRRQRPPNSQQDGPEQIQDLSRGAQNMRILPRTFCLTRFRAFCILTHNNMQPCCIYCNSICLKLLSPVRKY